MHELTNRVVELDDLLGADGELVEQLHDAPDWRPASRSSTRFSCAVSTRRGLASRCRLGLAAAGRHRRSPARGRAVRARPAASTCCAGSTADRRRAETYARVLRFQRAVRARGHRDGAGWVDERELGAGRRMSWGEIALECGYSTRRT